MLDAFERGFERALILLACTGGLVLAGLRVIYPKETIEKAKTGHRHVPGPRALPRWSCCWRCACPSGLR